MEYIHKTVHLYAFTDTGETWIVISRQDNIAPTDGRTIKDAPPRLIRAVSHAVAADRRHARFASMPSPNVQVEIVPSASAAMVGWKAIYWRGDHSRQWSAEQILRREG